jgi:mannuronan 5-epimerase
LGIHKKYVIFLSLIIIISIWLPCIVLATAQRSMPLNCTNYNSITNIITVICNTSLSQIYNNINNRNVLEKDPSGIWILKSSIIVNPQSKLTINHNDASWIKITNNKNNQPNYISISGSAVIDGVKITSWNQFSNSTIKQFLNGSIPRPYIIADKATGSLNISNSEFAFLGYNSYPSNGLVFAKSGKGSNIINNNFHDMWDGFYSHSSGPVAIKNNKYYNNLRYGIDPHSGSHDINISGNNVYNNTKIGLICSENCYNILFENNTVHNNGYAGLMFSLQTNNSTMKNNTVHNEKVGISIASSSNDNIYGNALRSNDIGIFIGGNSSNNHFFNNTLTNHRVGFEFADNPKNNTIENNKISNATSTLFARH